MGRICTVASKMTKESAFITGASGTVGPSLVRLLLGDKYRVRTLVRSETGPGVLPAEAEQVCGDVTDGMMLGPALDAVDVVFHVAAKLHINDPSPELADEYHRVNVEGTRNVARAAREAGVRRFIHFSTINVYGPSHPDVIYDETSEPAPDTIYGRTKLESEEVALHEHPGTTVLRLAAVYGPRMRGNYPLLLKALGKGLPMMIGDGRNRRTLVHVEDVARAAMLVAERDDAIGKVYNVTDGGIHSFDDVARAMQRAMGKKERMIYLPASPVRAGLSGVEKALGLVGIRSPIGPSLVDKLTEDMAADGSRLQRELGFQPKYSLKDGWQATIAELKAK